MGGAVVDLGKGEGPRPEGGEGSVYGVCFLFRGIVSGGVGLLEFDHKIEDGLPFLGVKGVVSVRGGWGDEAAGRSLIVASRTPMSGNVEVALEEEVPVVWITFTKFTKFHDLLVDVVHLVAGDGVVMYKDNVGEEVLVGKGAKDHTSRHQCFEGQIAATEPKRGKYKQSA